MKKPWISALLNLAFFGAGYLYNGERKAFGAALIASWILIRAGEIPIYLSRLVFDQWLILFFGIVILQIGLAVDGFREAKAINAAKAGKLN
jgi:hypothetical protein